MRSVRITVLIHREGVTEPEVHLSGKVSDLWMASDILHNISETLNAKADVEDAMAKDLPPQQ